MSTRLVTTVRVAGAQLPGRQRAEYAVLLHTGDWRSGGCYEAADAVLVPFERARAVVAASPAPRPASGAALGVDGAEVSAVLRTPGGLLVRVFRSAADRGPVSIEYEGAPAHGWVIDLQGRPVAPFAGLLELRPWEICTVQLT